MAEKRYAVVAIDLSGVTVRKPRRPALFTLRSLEDGSTFQVKLRSMAGVGDLITLDESQVQMARWIP